MKKIILLISSMIIVVNIFGNGLSLNSPGPRALALGGAFTARADDATAIFWNPASLANQESSAKFALTDVIPFATYKTNNDDFGSQTEFDISAESELNHYFNPNLFINYVKDRLALGAGIYVPAGLGIEYPGEDLKSLTANPDYNYPGSAEIEWSSKIGVLNFSPAVAYKISKELSLGMAANIYYGTFQLERLAGVYPDQNQEVKAYQYSEDSDGIGLSATISMNLHPNDNLSFGLTYRLPTKVTLEGEAENKAMEIIGLSQGMTEVSKKSDFEREVTWPSWLAFGFSYKPIDNLTLSLDAQYSKWEQVDEFVTEFEDEDWDQLTAFHDENVFTMNWQYQTQIRFGAEYSATSNLDLRGGYYYDPAPSPDETLNVLFPSSTNHVATGGFGYKLNKFQFDFGMEYLFGQTRDIDLSVKWYDDDGDGVPSESEYKKMNFPGEHHMDVMAFSFGVGYYF